MNQEFDLLQIDDISELEDQLLRVGAESGRFPASVGRCDRVKKITSRCSGILAYGKAHC